MTSRTRATLARTLFAATTARALTAAATLAAGVAAQAHTGHGHDELGTFQGLLHALREPDHLVLIALGVIVVGTTSPYVLRAAAWLGARVAAAVRRAPATRQGLEG